MSGTPNGSVRVILFALGANTGIAIAKFIGAHISGSAALLAEAIHSTADCGNQVLLLIGAKAAGKPPSASHPLGYGRENFFWSFVVALVLFSMGGLFSIYEGVHKLSSSEPLGNPIVGLAVLVLGIILESIAFRACLKEIRLQNTYPTLREWFRKSTSAEMLTIFTEDAAALLGLSSALICLMAAWLTGNPFWDALGSVIIGVILVGTAFFLARETKSLLIGEAPATAYEPAVDAIVRVVIPGASVIRFVAQQVGSSEVMIAYKVLPGEIKDAHALIDALNEVERQVRGRFPEIKWQFVEPDHQA